MREEIPQQRIEELAAALRRAAEDRRRPLVIMTTELLRLYAAGSTLTPNIVCRIGRSTPAKYDLYRALGGRARWGSAPVYKHGRWAL